MAGKRELVGRGASPLMPGARVREDGWTDARTKVFLGKLGQTGCVTDAARVAGISCNSVRRARALYAPFDKACRGALARALRGLEAIAYQRAVEGRETVIIRKGQEVERRIMPSDTILKLLIQRGDMAGLGDPLAAGAVLDSRGRALGPEDVLTREEHDAGWCFEQGGGKTDAHAGARAALEAKLNEMAARMGAEERAGGGCRRCHQPIGAAAWDEIVRRGGGVDPYGGYVDSLHNS